MEKIKACLIVLQESKPERYLKFVSPEVYRWIVDDDLGQKLEDKNKTSWIDQTCTKEISEQIRADYTTEELESELEQGKKIGEVEITRGTYNNDRAIQAPELKINGESLAMFIDEGRDMIGKNYLTQAIEDTVKKYNLELYSQWWGFSY